MHELELKFQVDPTHSKALEAAWRNRLSRRVHLVAHGYDTADGCLARHALALRVFKKGGAPWTQCLEAPGHDGRPGVAHEVPFAAGRVHAQPPADIGMHEHSEAGRTLRAALHEDGRTASDLMHVHTTDLWRRTAHLQVDGSTIELTLEAGAVAAGDKAAEVCELALELKQGDPASFASLARQVVLDHHGLWLSVASNAQRAQHLVRGEAYAPVVKAQAPQLDDKMGGEAVMRAVLAACLKQILGNAGEVAAGSLDEEHIHQLRIGIRRLRTAVRELGQLSPQISPSWEAPWVEAFQALGAFRDKDTVMSAIGPQLEAAGAPKVQWQSGPAPARLPGEVVRAAQLQTALIELAVFSRGEGGSVEGGPEAVRKHLRKRLGKLHRATVADGKHFEELDAVAQHRVRKRLKRLRYLAEFVSSLFGEKAVERYLKHLRPAQDALGLLNDAAVAQALYRDAVAAGAHEAWFAVGWLQSQRAITARACRKALCKVADAQRFW
jgi:triphosphatase